MDNQPYTPLRHNGPLSHSVYPNIYFTPGRSSPRPTQEQLPTSYRYFPYTPPGLRLPFVHRRCIPTAENITSVNEEQVAPIRELESASTQECVQKFKEWHSGKGAFRSPDTRENGLTMKMTMPHFLDFKKALDMDDDEK